jgi:hypothetical protein
MAPHASAPRQARSRAQVSSDSILTVMPVRVAGRQLRFGIPRRLSCL